MPSLPTNNKCGHLGCKSKKAKMGGYCLEHGGRNYSRADDKRKAFNSMYYTKFWKQTKAIQLSKQPLCQCCLVEGKVRSASHVDHLFAWKHIGDEAFKQNIFQSLCTSCHTYKTMKEQEGIYLHFTNNQSIAYNLNDYSFVVKKQQEG